MYAKKEKIVTPIAEQNSVGIQNNTTLKGACAGD